MPRDSIELFLGGLNKDTRRSDIEGIFSKYGRLTRCDIKYVNSHASTAYGFVGYSDERDAENAIKAENGRKICGAPVLIERSKTKPWNKGSKISTRDKYSRRSDRYGYRRSHRSSSRSSRTRSRDRSTRHRRRRSRTISRSRSISRSRREYHRSSRRDDSRSRNRASTRSGSRSRSRSIIRNNRNSAEIANVNNEVVQTENGVENKSDHVELEHNYETDLNDGNSANGIFIDENTLTKNSEIKEVFKEDNHVDLNNNTVSNNLNELTYETQ